MQTSNLFHVKYLAAYKKCIHNALSDSLEFQAAVNIRNNNSFICSSCTKGWITS